MQVRIPASGALNSHGVTGGVYKARERIHRGMLIRDYWQLQLHVGGLQPTIRTETAFLRSASPYGVASLCYSHCSTCVAQDKGHDDLTSPPPSSELSPAVLPESPPLRAGNWQQGLRSLRDLTQHLTTRADDNHAPPVLLPPKRHHVSMTLSRCQALVRFFALRRIKHTCSAACAGPRQFL